MKGFRLSKTSWLILSTGLFLVVLAGLGLTRTQQLEEQSDVNEQLGISEVRLSKSDVSDLRYRIEELELKIKEGKARLDDAILRLRKTVASDDVTEEFYNVAVYSGVEIMQFGTMPVSRDALRGINISQTSVSARVEGQLADVIDFIINLNNSFQTGYIANAALQIQEPPASGNDTEAETSASVQLIIYSYEGP